VNELVRTLRKDAPIGANRILAYLKTFFTWAVDQELIEASPAASVKRPAKEVKRDRFLTDLEIRAIWQACGTLGAFGRAFRFMLAAGQRCSEVDEMTWSEIDRTQRLWTLSRERTKADRGHEIPLSELAIAIVEECPPLGDFVFSTGRARPISGWSKAKAALDAKYGVTNWHVHDLRRTAATNMTRLGVDRVVIAKILNHAEPEITAIYDRHRYDREKRRALEVWGGRLAAIIGGTGEGNILSHATARG
jgi:integrase